MKKPLRIFCDFDGTITQKDTVDFLLTHLADPLWEAIEERWVKGEIGSRECMAEQIPLIQGGWPAIESMLERLHVDPTFPDFVTWCAQKQIPLVVVSEGMDRVIQAILEREGIHVDGVWANRLEISPEDGKLSLSFPFAPPDADCRAGLCKCRVLEQTSARQYQRVVIGDGRSDLCWAKDADILFAKSSLLKYCIENQVACRAFGDFNMIRQVLESYLQNPSTTVDMLLTLQHEDYLHA